MTNFEKPVGAACGWHVFATDYVFENDYYHIRRDSLQIDGEKKTYSYLERGDAVIIVPVTAEGDMILLRQYRYPIDEWCWEVPAGGMRDSDGLSIEEVARKELSEEIGATACHLEYLDSFYTANSLMDEKCHIFLATAVECDSEAQTEITEKIEVHRKPIAEALEMVRSGQMKTGQCALAVLLSEARLRANGLY